MPRSPDTYTLPPGTTPQAPNTVIGSAMFNAAMDDIATTFNTAWPVAIGVGAAGATGSWDSINAVGSDIASAGTINLTTATGPNLTITGTTTITTVTLGSGNVRFARANAAFQLTASANLIINGSASTNYTTTAGDLLIFIGGSGSVTRVWTLPAAASANYFSGYTTTATAAGTTTLTVASTFQQFFTGTTTQTIVLPVTSTLSLGHSYRIVNNSTDLVTVQSSGANEIVQLGIGMECTLTCILTSGTTAASWSYKFQTSTAMDTPLALNTGTTRAFSKVPTGVRRIEITAPAISLNADTSMLVQLGTSGGFVTTGYVSGSNANNSGQVVTSTAGFIAYADNGSTYNPTFKMFLVDAATNQWSYECTYTNDAATQYIVSSGRVTLSGPATQVRINSVNGTATFDGTGNANAIYTVE